MGENRTVETYYQQTNNTGPTDKSGWGLFPTEVHAYGIDYDRNNKEISAVPLDVTPGKDAEFFRVRQVH